MGMKRVEELIKREIGLKITGFFVVEGYATYKLKALQVADRENNYLLLNRGRQIQLCR